MPTVVVFVHLFPGEQGCQLIRGNYGLVLQQATFARLLSNGDSTPLTLFVPQSLTCCYTGNKLVGALAESSTGNWRREKPCLPRQHRATGPETARPSARRGAAGLPRLARQYHPGRGRHVENTIMSALVRAGLVPRSCLLMTQGRKTGRPRTNPVVAVEHGGRRWLVAPYGPVSWVHNARATGRVSLARRRDTRDYTVREVPPDEAGPVLLILPVDYALDRLSGSGVAGRARISRSGVPSPRRARAWLWSMG